MPKAQKKKNATDKADLIAKRGTRPSWMGDEFEAILKQMLEKDLELAPANFTKKNYMEDALKAIMLNALDDDEIREIIDAYKKYLQDNPSHFDESKKWFSFLKSQLKKKKKAEQLPVMSQIAAELVLEVTREEEEEQYLDDHE